MQNIDIVKADLIAQIDKRLEDRIIEPTNAELLKKLINNAESTNEAMMIAELGTTYKRTGFHFDKRLEKLGSDIKFLKKNNQLSFSSPKQDSDVHKLIIGDNYDALQQLLITHRDMIDVIYIDPPYGADSMGSFANTNYTNAITRDNLLSMLYTRLQLARNLLSESGVIFCSIDDKNMAYVKCLFDEIFGEKNFISNIFWQNKYTVSNDKKNGMTIQTEYILCFAKYIESLSFNPDTLRKEYVEKNYKNPDNDPNGPYMTVQLYKKKNPKSFSVVSPTGKEWNMPWNYTPETFAELEKEGKVWWGKDGEACPRKKVYLKDSQGMGHRNLWLGEDVGYQQDGGDMIESIFNDRNVFDYPKPVSLIKKILQISSNKNSIVLDFFAGSGTTGQAVLELNKEDNGNRQFILCTNNEITNRNPNGIAYDATSKRLKRVMTGSCYDDVADFKWNKKNEALGGSLRVYEIESVNNSEQSSGKSPFDVIDEACYDMPKFTSIQEKIAWVCNNFEHTQKYIKEEE